MLKFATFEKMETIDSERSVVGWASRPTIDRENELIKSDAWDTKNYEKSGMPLLLSHDYSSVAVGRAMWIKTTPQGLRFKAEFADTERGRELYSLYKDGFMKAFSVGFRVKEGGVVYNPTEKEYKGVKALYTDVELLEISCVSVPANVDAISEILKSGKIKTKELNDELIKIISIGEIENEEKKEENDEDIIEKIEVTDNYIHIPAKGQEGKHSGHKIRTITISAKDKIKGKYCIDCKIVIGYMFDTSKWTKKEALKWMKDNNKELNINEIIEKDGFDEDFEENIYIEKGASLNASGRNHLNSLIRAGKIDRNSDWSFSAEDGNSLLGDDDWTEYKKWFLGVDISVNEKTKGHYKYPFGKNDKIYRSGVVAIKQRASQQGATDIANAASRALNKIDAKKDFDEINEKISMVLSNNNLSDENIKDELDENIYDKVFSEIADIVAKKADKNIPSINEEKAADASGNPSVNDLYEVLHRTLNPPSDNCYGDYRYKWILDIYPLNYPSGSLVFSEYNKENKTREFWQSKYNYNMKEFSAELVGIPQQVLLSWIKNKYNINSDDDILKYVERFGINMAKDNKIKLENVKNTLSDALSKINDFIFISSKSLEEKEIKEDDFDIEIEEKSNEIVDTEIEIEEVDDSFEIDEEELKTVIENVLSKKEIKVDIDTNKIVNEVFAKAKGKMKI